MKKSLLALAVLGAFAGAASAQSSVTLFGGLDVSSRTIKNEINAAGDTKTQRLMAKDGVYASRFGIRGVEDLGGGAKAGFHLEAALTPDTGSTTANNQLFNRRSTVSLFANFGEVRLGRDYTPQFWNITNFDPFGTNGVANINALNSVTNVTTERFGMVTDQVRTNNSVGYILPSNLGGVYGQLQLSTAEAETPNGGGNTGGRLGYAAGPVDVAVAIAQTKMAPVTVNGNKQDEKLKTVNVGASFQAGPAKLMTQYQQMKMDVQQYKQNTFGIGAVVDVGVAGKFKLSYAQTKVDDADAATADDKATLIGLGYEHNLSKRTSVYVNYAQISNKNDSAIQIGKPYENNAYNVAAGKKSTGYEFGVKHTF